MKPRNKEVCVQTIATVVAVTGIAGVLAVPLLGLWPILGWSGGVLSLGVLGAVREQQPSDERTRKRLE